MTRLYSIPSALTFGAMAILMACSVQSEKKRPFSSRPPDPIEMSSQEGILVRLEKQEERIQSLKASQYVRILDQRKGLSMDAHGLLAIQKPDRYRIRLYSAVGFTFLDFVLSPKGFHLKMPSKGIDISGKREEVPEKIAYFPVEALRESFFHSFKADRVEWHQLDQCHLLVLHNERQELNMIERLIDQKLLVVLKETFFREGVETLSIDYSDYRSYPEDENLLLPYGINVCIPNGGPNLEIRVLEYEINPTFQDTTFRLSP